MLDTEAKVVEEYHLSVVEKDSFKVVIVKFKCADGSVASFEFHPAYGHSFSDEMCITSIRAMAKTSPE
jgi:hypothetical protein